MKKFKTLEQVKLEHVARVLKAAKNQEEAAKTLQIGKRTLTNYVRKLKQGANNENN